MNTKHALKHPERLTVLGPNNETYTGGSQEWYTDTWHKRAGCGPVTAATLLWYTAREIFVPNGADTVSAFIQLMDDIFKYVTPTMKGVNTSDIFTDGLTRFTAERNVSITQRVMEIPAVGKRPAIKDAAGFITDALNADAPVAFLNLSNGTLKNLDNWHWVTVFAYDGDTHQADICDLGNAFTIDMAEWLRSTALGGAFVYFTVGGS